MSESLPDIVVYGAFWCPDCRRSKQFLGEHRIPYQWVNIEEDAGAEQRVIEMNDGRRIIPTIVFADGSRLVEPSNAELAAKLGLRTTASRQHYPVVVIGGGPAGLTAALYLAREGVDILIIERAAFGGQAAATEKLDNLPGFPDGVDGFEFAQRLRAQAERFGVELLQAQDVATIQRQGNYHRIETVAGDEYSAQAVLIATGSRYRRLNVPGENDYLGAGVHFCATCDGPFYKGKEVAVIGGGNSAAEESLLLTKFAERVTLLVRGPVLHASQVIQESVAGNSKIEVRWNTEVQEFLGARAQLNELRLWNNQAEAESHMSVDGAFVFIGLEPNTGFLEGSGVRLNKWGFIETGHNLTHESDKRPPLYVDRDPVALESSVPGLFAAGDVRADSTKQVASAAGEGATAALLIRDYLRTV
ncbi:MAG: FAD-dependent oxidoreductase [Caldilineaceae bacterium]|uniref:FAD-dependent oxidoreductase n=1 Tax=Caldilineaceae bacterium SB0675_bin_29 TaxID=2605266 RepID=A0A6B1G2R6_9CHLR|nr:FAD-dependent oxidoreductase [Caldilineaceae bacterium]MYH63793.1 FAD-dependent oxidoreductase [Caldilineaceae bacterium SB0675_bin_29]